MNYFAIYKVLALYLLPAIFLHYSALANTCPPEEIIRPCTCGYITHIEATTYKLVAVTCADLKYHEVLRQVFNRVNGWKFYYLFIERASMLYIPASIFENSEFSQLEIKDSTLTSLFDVTPVSVKSIKRIDILTSTIQQGIRWNRLKNFELEDFYVLDTVIRELGKDFKESIGKSSNLKYLKFVNNGIRRLTNQPFENSHNLENLRLENQKFKSLEPLVLPEGLKLISLSGNNFSRIPDHFFGNRPNIYVDFTNNSLTSMPQELFGIFRGTVALNDNPLDCTCGMKWLTDKTVNKINRLGGACATPRKLKDKHIYYLEAADFDYCM